MTNQVKLHVGYIGETREGKRVEIVERKDNLMFYTSKGVGYYQDGALSVINDTDDDIIGPWTDDKPEYETGVWYGWNGGECPVHPETVVDIADHDGTSINVLAGEWKWDHKYDPIIAFRIVTPYVEPEPKLDGTTLMFDPNVYTVWYDNQTKMVHVHRMIEAEE